MQRLQARVSYAEGEKRRHAYDEGQDELDHEILVPRSNVLLGIALFLVVGFEHLDVSPWQLLDVRGRRIRLRIGERALDSCWKLDKAGGRG